MTTTYTPVDRDFLFSLALAKAHGTSWAHIAEKCDVPVLDLEIIPWREPQAWANACRYAEKLVAHDVLAEMIANLRADVKNPTTNVRLKSQISNSLVRANQLQQDLRTPKRPVAKKSRPRPTPEPTPASAPVIKEPIIAPTVNNAKPASTNPLGTVAAILLLVLVGALMCWRVSVSLRDESPAVVMGAEQGDYTVSWASAPNTAPLDVRSYYSHRNPQTGREIEQEIDGTHAEQWCPPTWSNVMKKIDWMYDRRA